MLDTYQEVITPEGVPLQLPAAGAVPRALAWLIDPGGALRRADRDGHAARRARRLRPGLYLVAMFLVFWAYPIVLEGWFGQTLGKKALGLRVVARDGAPAGWMAAITRNLLRTVDMPPFGYAIGLIACLFDAHARRLGDMVAGTLVIHQTPRHAAALPPIASAVAPPCHPSPAEQAAVIAFAERAPRLAPARQLNWPRWRRC
nr:RDD family protein [Curtobacterium flaccumfaciens]